MDFELSKDQQLFQESVRKLAERHFAQGALARPHQAGFPFDAAKICC